ncbi:MAG: hypothetical protein ABI895_14370 [Deltaproteobacteria bacterium]
MVIAVKRGRGLLFLLGVACTSDLSSVLEGLQCRAEQPRCLPGYLCSADNRCLRSLPPEAGASGASAVSSGGSGAGQGGNSTGEGGAAGATQLPTGGSSGDPSDGGISGSLRYDAGPGLDALDASVFPDAQTCATPVPLFRDEDEDSFGVTAQQILGCPPLTKWAVRGGDCRDDLLDVHPEQTTFFPTGYPDPTRPSAGNSSFDYDCDFIEELAPGTLPAPNCAGLLTCEGSGYVAASPARSGPGVSQICGSTGLSVCQSTTILGLSCAAQPLAGVAARCQ